MKTFVISISIFLALCTFVTLNARIVCSRTDELISKIENLPKEPNDALSGEILNLWFEHEALFNLTVNHNITDQIEISLYNLKNAHDASSLAYARDSLLVLLKDMKNSSSLSLDRII